MRTIATLILSATAALAQIGPISLPPKPTLTPATPQQTIAFMGDSWAAGEGAPNTTGSQWDDRDCHRSKLNGRYAAAVALQGAAGTTFLSLQGFRQNVDFIDVSCSGATINAGILGPYEGVFEMRPDGPRPKIHPNGLPPQIDQVETWLNGRALDTLVISIGGNDAGFGRVVSDCMNPFISNCSTNSGTLKAMQNGDKVTVNGKPVSGRLIGFNNLEAAFQEMDKQIRDRLHPKRILLVDYPNPLRKGADLCHDFDDGVAIFSLAPDSPTASFSNGWLGIGASVANVNLAEANFIETSLYNRLNNSRGQFAADLGWDFLDVSAFSVNHGYCAPKAWFNTPADAISIQADFNGTAHPNAAGYRLFEWFLKRELAHTMNVKLTTGSRVDDESFFVSYPPPPQPSSGPQAQSMNKPPVIVNDDTYDQLPPDQKQYINDHATLNLVGLFYPTPDHVQSLTIEVSTRNWDFNPAATDIIRYTVPLKTGPEGTYLASAPLLSYGPNTDLYIRWRVKYTPFWDTSDVRYWYSTQTHYVVKDSIPVRKVN